MLRPSIAFAALISYTICSLPGWPENLTRKLADLIGRAPVYFVDTGADPGLLPDAFARFLDGL